MTDIDELFRNTTKERIVRYYIREYEKQRSYIFPICSAAAGKQIETGLTIVDLSRGSMVLLTERCYSFVRIAANLCQNYFPETLGVYRDGS
jgi:hypothetical protein